MITMTANIAPYFAFGNATPLILLGLNSSLLFSSDIIDFDLNDWSNLQFETGKITKFITPRDLVVF